MSKVYLKLWTGLHQSLASVICGELCEVLDESAREVFSFLVPILNICVGVAWIQNLRVNAWQCCRNLEVEIWNLLGWSLLD